MKKITITVEGMHCPKCSAKVEAAITDKFATERVKVSLADKTVTVETKIALDHDSLAATIKALGFEATDIKTEECEKKRSIVKIFRR